MASKASKTSKTSKAGERRRELDRLAPVRGDRVFDGHGELRCMAVGDGYVMCRYSGCIPFVVSVRDWAKLAPAD